MFTVRSIVRNGISYRKMSAVTNGKTQYKRGGTSFLKRNLFLINSITSGGFMGLGDFVQQEIEYQYKLIPKRYDWGRLARMFTVGCLLGPIHHVYYVKLDKWLPGTTTKVVLIKIVADQLLCSPATIVCFFYSMGYLEGKSTRECTTEMKNKFTYVYLGDWIFWPPVQFINFQYLPTQYRVIYINVVTMVFNVFLSFIKHYDQH